MMAEVLLTESKSAPSSSSRHTLRVHDALEGLEPVGSTTAALAALVKELAGGEEILAWQEVGTMSYLVHDTLLRQRQEAALATDLRRVDSDLRRKAGASDAIARLKTIPALGDLVATTIHAWVGEIGRFPDAKSLATLRRQRADRERRRPNPYADPPGVGRRGAV